MDSEVQFDEVQDYSYSQTRAVTSSGYLQNMLVKMGVARDESNATRILVGLFVVCALLSFIFFYKSNSSSRADTSNIQQVKSTIMSNDHEPVPH